MPVLRCIILVPSGLLLLVAMILGGRSLIAFTTQPHLEATVVRFEHPEPLKERHQFTPVFRTGPRHGSVEYLSTVSSFPAAFEIGAPVAIIASATQPGKATAATVTDFFMPALIFGGIGGLGVALAIWVGRR